MSDGLDTTSIGSLLIDPTDATRQHDLRRHRRAERRQRERGGPRSLPVDERRQQLVARRGQRARRQGSRHRRHRGRPVESEPHPDRHRRRAARDRPPSGGRFTPPGAPRLGLYESSDGGETFTRIFERAQDLVNPDSANGSDFFRGGITDLEVDPQAPGTFYFTMFNEGVFRSTAGVTTQIFTEPNPDGPGGLGIRYQVATAELPDGKTRIYLGQGSNEVGVVAVRRRVEDAADGRRAGGDRRLDDALEQRARVSVATTRGTSAGRSALTTCRSPHRPAGRTRSGSAASRSTRSCPPGAATASRTAAR